jgi:catechol 2,3-dioxygenase
MTAIHGYIQPSRRPGELGVHSVDHFHFAVPDLTVAQNFYGEFGLDVGQRGDRLTLSTFAQSHIWGTIGEGPRKKLGYVSFGAFEDDIERFSAAPAGRGHQTARSAARDRLEWALVSRPQRHSG